MEAAEPAVLPEEIPDVELGAEQLAAEPVVLPEEIPDVESGEEQLAADEVSGVPSLVIGSESSDPTEPEAPTLEETEDDSAFADELEEIEFYLGQELYDEAREILNELLSRHPNHPSLTAIAAKFDENEGSSQEESHLSEQIEPSPQRAEISNESASSPQVMLEQPIADEDAETHYDLGVAYREMGLHSEAISAFEKVLNVAGRRVQSRLMLGLCQRDQGNFSQSIQYFQDGLSIPEISESERLNLHYEIAVSYESMANREQALHFFELVIAQDQAFRDAGDRIAKLK